LVDSVENMTMHGLASPKSTEILRNLELFTQCQPPSVVRGWPLCGWCTISVH